MNSAPIISLASGATTALDIDLIDPSPLNPRQDVDGDLVSSLRAVGQLDPILVRPKPGVPGRFEIANGQRRWKGAKAAGAKTLSARVRDLTDAQMLDVMLGTGGEGNVKPLTAMDEAIGYASALKVMGLSRQELADHFGINVTTLKERIALVDLPGDGKAAVAKGVLPAKTAYLIACVDDAEKRAELTKRVLTSPGGVMSFSATKAHIDENVCKTLRGARFDQKDGALLPDVGPCSECAFNTAHNRENYHEAPTGRCMRPSCFERKTEAARVRLIAREEKAGKKILSAEDNGRVFPAEEAGLAYNSGYVELAKPPTADLLKKEVAAALQPGSPEARTIRVPTWRELVAGKSATVQVWVGFDRSGHVVDLVKIEEALLAADENERAIFNAETIKRYNLDKGAAALKSDRTRKLGVVAPPPAAATAPEGQSPVSYAVVLGSLDVGGGTAYVMANWSERAAAWMRNVLKALPTMPAVLRDHGESLLRDLPRAEASAPSPVECNADRLAEWQKAHALEMSAQKIAATYRVPLEDVCGALALDVHHVRNEFSQLRQDAEEALTAAGMGTSESRSSAVKLATNAATFEELTTPEQMRAVLSMLSRVSAARAKPVKPPAGEDTE